MTAPHLYLVDNTHPVDLPDLYDGIGAYDDELPPGVALAYALGYGIRRAWGMAFWIALGLCVGVML